VKLISPNKERLNPTSTHAETAEPFSIDKEKPREHALLREGKIQ